MGAQAKHFKVPSPQLRRAASTLTGRHGNATTLPRGLLTPLSQHAAMPNRKIHSSGHTRNASHAPGWAYAASYPSVHRADQVHDWVMKDHIVFSGANFGEVTPPEHLLQLR